MMVVTMWWMESWTVVIMSLCVLSIIAILLLCCIWYVFSGKGENRENFHRSWDNRRSGLRHFYVLDEKGNKKFFLPNSDKTAVSLSNKTDNGICSSVVDGNFKQSFEMLHKENSLGSPVDGVKNSPFRDLVLRIEENVNKDDHDEVLSCISTDSKYTYYSTYPMVRTMSTADTIRSALSHPDLSNAK